MQDCSSSIANALLLLSCTKTSNSSLYKSVFFMLNFSALCILWPCLTGITLTSEYLLRTDQGIACRYTTNCDLVASWNVKWISLWHLPCRGFTYLWPGSGVAVKVLHACYMGTFNPSPECSMWEVFLMVLNQMHTNTNEILVIAFSRDYDYVNKYFYLTWLYNINWLDSIESILSHLLSY